jgi:8-hydroxy-5-deazaflavin:NADPH oxidoreductase
LNDIRRSNGGSSMQIAIIGAGSVGGTLGRRLAEAGHHVAFGVRNPDDPKYRALAEALGDAARVAAPADAAAGADALIVATPWNQARAALESAGELASKVVIDATNPLLPALAGLDWRDGLSGAQQLASSAPGARVFKAFNTTGFNIMAEPEVGGRASIMLVAGDDPAGKELVLGLARDIGFEAEDAGGLDQAGLLENLALLWIRLAYKQGLGRDFAFALLRR